MAMVITDNSPGAGSVAWTGMAVNYKGSDYNITNGNSDKKFLWWDLTSPTVLQTADTFPTLTDDDQIILLNLSGLHYLVPTRTIVQAALLTGTMTDFISTPSSAPTADYHITNKKYVDELGTTDGWLEAGETWTYASADAPTYTFTLVAFDATSKYSAGMKIKLTDSGTQYGIITKVVFDDPGSTITIYMGTDYSLSSGSITNPFYSMARAPLDFPMDPDKWTIEVTDTSLRTQASPVQNTWYNLSAISIDVPLGLWSVGFYVYSAQSTSGATKGHEVTLSKVNNTEDDPEFTSGAVGYADSIVNTARFKILDLAVKDTYYLNIRTGNAGVTTLWFGGNTGTTILKSICAYL